MNETRSGSMLRMSQENPKGLRRLWQVAGQKFRETKSSIADGLSRGWNGLRQRVENSAPVLFVAKGRAGRANEEVDQVGKLIEANSAFLVKYDVGSSQLSKDHAKVLRKRVAGLKAKKEEEEKRAVECRARVVAIEEFREKAREEKQAKRDAREARWKAGGERAIAWLVGAKDGIADDFKGLGKRAENNGLTLAKAERRVRKEGENIVKVQLLITAITDSLADGSDLTDEQAGALRVRIEELKKTRSDMTGRMAEHLLRAKEIRGAMDVLRDGGGESVVPSADVVVSATA